MHTYNKKDIYAWERILKGGANHHRLEILLLLRKHGELSTEDIVENLDLHYQTGAHHAQKLAKAGLVAVHREGATQLYKLSSHGSTIINLLIKL